MARPGATTEPQVEVTLRGDIPPWVGDMAREKIAALARYTREPTRARVRLTKLADPAVERPVIAQGNLYLRGRLARAQVTAQTPTEAVDLLQERLRRRMARLEQHWEARRGAQPTGEPGEWRHGQLPTERPPYFPRPPEERQIVVHKTYGPTVSLPDEAAVDMELLDYDFYLFTDAISGEDAVIYRAPPHGYRLAALTSPPDHWPPEDLPITVSELPAPTLTREEAVARLNLTGLPFVFYADAQTGRGHVLYRRYDGHYGLIVPADQ